MYLIFFVIVICFVFVRLDFFFGSAKIRIIRIFSVMILKLILGYCYGLFPISGINFGMYI